ncbi:interleukin-13 receptor subunit alpha-1 [Discoglossus pictus]
MVLRARMETTEIYTTLALLLCISWHCIGTVAGHEEGLNPPTNLRFEMDAFNLIWKWDLPKISKKWPNCNICYHSQYGKQNNLDTRESCSLTVKVNLEYAERSMIDLNDEIHFKTRSQCQNDSSIKSQWVNMSILLTKDDESAVRDFSCIWHNKQYMNCTWEPGKSSPPGTDFVLLYWVKHYKGDDSKGKPTQFQELLNSGNPCPQYIYKDGVTLGCHFRDHKAPRDSDIFTMVVTDSNKTIQPFIAIVKVDDKIKLSPPNIVNITRTPSHTIYVRWNESKVIGKQCLMYEVEVTNPKSEKPDMRTVPQAFDTEIHSASPDVDYTVRVRVGQKMETCGEFYWSEWSKSQSLPGNQSGDTLYIIPLLLIPIVLTISTIILLIYIKRLRILVFPPIPDPGKMLKKNFGDPNELQQWIKHGKFSVSSKPPKEEICSVILIESPSSSSHME